MLLLAFHTTSLRAAIFNDGTLADADWTDFTIAQDSTPPATFSGGQSLTGGNPGAYRAVSHTFGFGTIAVGHLRNDFTWDPGSQGAITSLDGSYDAIFESGTAPGAIAFSLLLEQGGSYFVQPTFDNIFLGSGWSNFSHTALVATDFVELLSNVTFVPTSHPDFSANGDIITFGYLSGNSAGPQTQTKNGGLDNYFVEINFIENNAVPEPATVSVLLTGVAAAGLLRRRRRHSA